MIEPRPRRPSRRGRIALAFGIPSLLAIAGIGFLIAGMMAIGSGPPTPDYPAPVPGAKVWSSTVHVQPMTPSEPVKVVAPSIGVDASVAPVGLSADGTVGLPPLSQPYLAGWYRYGRTPGEQGSSVIIGHVDSYASGRAVFYNLGHLTRGAVIEVTRRDHSVAEFKVDAVTIVQRDRFPAPTVYGQVPYPGLRLVTCGGTFDSRSGSYPDNVVVFASLVGRRTPLLGLIGG